MEINELIKSQTLLAGR